MPAPSRRRSALGEHPDDPRRKRRGRGRRSSSATGSPRPAATSSTARAAGARRPQGDRLRRPRPRRVRPRPARPGLWIPGAGRRSRGGGRRRGGGGPFRLWPATRWAPTRRSPTPCAIPTARRPGRDRAVYSGDDLGRDSLDYWDGLATALEDGRRRRLRRLHRPQPGDRSGLARLGPALYPRADAACTATSMRWWSALREVPRSRPFEALEELAGLTVPALVVASHDDADPGHPYDGRRGVRERLPRRGLVSEAEGQSPLAWQGGRLSREIAASSPSPLWQIVFSLPVVGSNTVPRMKAPDRGHAAGRRDLPRRPRPRRCHLHRDRRLRAAALPSAWPAARLRDGRQQLLLAPARDQRRGLRDRRLRAAARHGASSRRDLARFGGFALSLVGFGFSVYLTYLELFKIKRSASGASPAPC